jgi:hypothetical protein
MSGNPMSVQQFFREKVSKSKYVLNSSRSCNRVSYTMLSSPVWSYRSVAIGDQVGGRADRWVWSEASAHTHRGSAGADPIN